MKIKTVVCSAIITGLLVVPALVKADDDKDGKNDDQRVAWKDLPAAVQTTITTNANGGTVGEVESENEDGKVTYEADVKGADGKKTEIKVAADGTLIKAEADDDDDNGQGKDKDDDDDK